MEKELVGLDDVPEFHPEGLEDDPLGSVSRSALHFFWLADCSGSMTIQGKMQAVNNAIHECIPATREANGSNAFADMLVRAIKFSNGAQWHVEEPTNVDDFEWQDPKQTNIVDSPKFGIRSFYTMYEDLYDVIFRGYQLGLIKK